MKLFSRKAVEKIDSLPLSNFCCQICSANAYTVKYSLRPHAVVACGRCGLYQLAPRVATEKLRALTDSAYHGDTFTEISNFRIQSDIADTNDPTVSEYTDILIALESATGGRNLLDIGCGSGDFMAIARERGWIVCGLDICPVPIRTANEQYRLEVACCSFEEYRETAKSFDTIIMLDFLEHVSSLKEVMKKAMHLLKDRGAIAFSFPNRRSLIYFVAGLLYRTRLPRLQRPALLLYDVAVCHTTFFAPKDVKTLCERYGLELLSIELKNPDIDRLNVPLHLSIMLRLMNTISSLLGLQSRMVAIARKKPNDG